MIASEQAWRTRCERCQGLGDPPASADLRRWRAEFDALPLASRNAVLSIRAAVSETMDGLFGLPTASLVPDFLGFQGKSRIPADPGG